MARDELVQSAIDNWAPRFIANGVDANDFQRVTNSIERWEDWCRRWSECGAMHEQMGEKAEAEGHYESAAYHYFLASISYHFGKYLFVRKPQELREAHEHTVHTYNKALPYFDFPAERVAIPYEGTRAQAREDQGDRKGRPYPIRRDRIGETQGYEGGAMMPGILRKPWHTPRPPVVIMIPGLDSVKEELHLYGNDFLRRGMAVLAIDGPGQGEMEFEYPMRFDYEVPVTAAINYLEQRPDLDASRVGIMGVSLGGYYSVRAAAFEQRVKATISNGGPYSPADNFKQRPIISRETYIHRLKAKNEEDALDKLKKFNLQGVVDKVTAPILVIAGRRDRLVPFAQGERIAAEAGSRAELWLFDDGNHVCNNIIYKHRPQQADWMRQKLNG